MQSISEILAQELNCKQEYIENVIALLGEGNTIPFIARYRKEQHGAMDDTALRTLETRLQYLRNLAQRREEVKSSIAAQEKLTDELAKAIDEAATLAEVEDLYRPYKPQAPHPCDHREGKGPRAAGGRNFRADAENGRAGGAGAGIH